MERKETTISTETIVNVPSGWPMLLVFFGTIIVTFFCFRTGFVFFGILALISCILTLTGFFTLQPNEARVLILFGTYKGTVRESGLHWSNPFYAKLRTTGGINVDPETHQTKLGQVGYKVSLRARTLGVPTMKVNDRRGNPIEIGAVVVWRIVNSAKALFDVENYSEFVRTQSETALRFLASHYAYDNGEDDEITLRSNIDDVSRVLCEELTKRLQAAGVEVDEARLTHLAYAPEIAQAMLRRQQAEAIIAARQKIVHGAVTMVEMAVDELSKKKIVDFEPAGKAAMVSNLMVVLCSESEVHPVVSAGAH